MKSRKKEKPKRITNFSRKEEKRREETLARDIDLEGEDERERERERESERV